MKYTLLILGFLTLIGCSSDASASHGHQSKSENQSNGTSDSDKLITKAVGKYRGKIKKQSSKTREGSDASVEVKKESETSVIITVTKGGTSSFAVFLDEDKSNDYALIFRDKKGARIASLMHLTLSFSLPLEDGDVESFNGVKE